MIPAKRGDLIVVRRVQSASFLRGGLAVSSTWWVGKVTKVDREGWATEFEYRTAYGPVTQSLRGRQGESWGKALDGLGTLVESQDRVDVDGFLATVPEPFESLEAVVEAARRFLYPRA